MVTLTEAIQSYNPINPRIVSSLDITELKLNGSYSARPSSLLTRIVKLCNSLIVTPSSGLLLCHGILHFTWAHCLQIVCKWWLQLLTHSILFYVHFFLSNYDQMRIQMTNNFYKDIMPSLNTWYLYWKVKIYLPCRAKSFCQNALR